MQTFKFGFIYKTTNLINKKIYLGQHIGNKPHYLGSGYALHKAIKKYGRKNFVLEIITWLDNQEQMNEFEKFIIEKYREILGRDALYNIADGGDGGPKHMLGKKHPEERKRKLSEKMKGWRLGIHTAESHKKHGESLKKLWQDPEYRKHMSDVHKGKKPNRVYKKGLIPWNKGKPMSNETKALISKNLKGKRKIPCSDTRKKQISDQTKALWADPEYRKRNLNGQSKIDQKEKGKKITEAQLKSWAKRKNPQLMESTK